MPKDGKELGDLVFFCAFCGPVVSSENMKCLACAHDVVIRRDSGQKNKKPRDRYKPLWAKGGRKP